MSRELTPEEISERAKKGIPWKQPPGPPLKKTREQFIPVTEGNPLSIPPQNEPRTVARVATPYGLAEFTSTQYADPLACDLFHPLDCAKAAVGVATAAATTAKQAVGSAVSAAQQAQKTAAKAITTKTTQTIKQITQAPKQTTTTTTMNKNIATQAQNQSARSSQKSAAQQKVTTQNVVNTIVSTVTNNQLTKAAQQQTTNLLTGLAAAGNLITFNKAGQIGETTGSALQKVISNRQTWTMPDGSKMDLTVGQTPETFCKASPQSPVCKQNVKQAIVTETAAQKTVRQGVTIANDVANATMRKVISLSDPVTQTIVKPPQVKPPRIRYNAISLKAYLNQNYAQFRSLTPSKQTAAVQQIMNQLRSKVVRS